MDSCVQPQPKRWWCILRTAGSATLKLASTLTQDGFEAWAPAETVKVTIKGKMKRSIVRPIMPGYVFVEFGRWNELLQLMRDIAIGKGTGLGRPNHVRFSLMKHDGKIVSVSERDMRALRYLSAKRTPLQKAEKAFGSDVVVSVKTGSGIFTGSVGKVHRSNHGYTHLFLSPKNGIRWKLPTCLLEEKGLEKASL